MDDVDEQDEALPEGDVSTEGGGDDGHDVDGLLSLLVLLLSSIELIQILTKSMIEAVMAIPIKNNKIPMDNFCFVLKTNSSFLVSQYLSGPIMTGILRAGYATD